MDNQLEALNEAVVREIHIIARDEPGRMAKLTILYFQVILRMDGLAVSDRDFPEVLRLVANSLEILNNKNNEISPSD